MGGERKCETTLILNFGNVQNRDHSRSDVKSSSDNEDPRVNQISSQPREVSLSQDVDIRSRENTKCSTRTALVEKSSSTPVNIVEVVSTDQSTTLNSSCHMDNELIDISDDLTHASSHTISGHASVSASVICLPDLGIYSFLTSRQLPKPHYQYSTLLPMHFPPFSSLVMLIQSHKIAVKF